MDSYLPQQLALQTLPGNPDWWMDFWCWWLLLVCLVGLWVILPDKRQ